jgi:hypothetical protein
MENTNLYLVLILTFLCFIVFSLRPVVWLNEHDLGEDFLTVEEVVKAINYPSWLTWLMSIELEKLAARGECAAKGEVHDTRRYSNLPYRPSP